jgi:hypothetical protein
MRFTVSRNAAAAIRELVAVLDRNDQPIAETCRRVGDAAVAAGLPRPSYANVRRLALAQRGRVGRIRAARTDLVADLAAGRVPQLAFTVDRLREALAERPVEPRVSETQGFEGER